MKLSTALLLLAFGASDAARAKKGTRRTNEINEILPAVVESRGGSGGSGGGGKGKGGNFAILFNQRDDCFVKFEDKPISLEEEYYYDEDNILPCKGTVCQFNLDDGAVGVKLDEYGDSGRIVVECAGGGDFRRNLRDAVADNDNNHGRELGRRLDGDTVNLVVTCPGIDQKMDVDILGCLAKDPTPGGGKNCYDDIPGGSVKTLFGTTSIEYSNGSSDVRLEFVVSCQD